MSKTAAFVPLSLVLTLAACEAIPQLLPPPPEELDLWADAAAGVTSPGLAQLCGEVWEAQLRHDPFQATLLGDPRWNGKVPDESLEGRLAWSARQQTLLARLRILQAQSLSKEDRLTATLLQAQLEDGIATTEFGLEEWVVDPLDGPHHRILNVAAVQPHQSAREREQLVDRWRAFTPFLSLAGRNLDRGRVGNRVASRTAVEKVIRQLDELLAVPPHLSPLVTIATASGRWVELPANGNLAAIAHEHLGDAREQSVLMRLNRHLADPARTALGTHLLLPIPGDPLRIEERGTFLSQVLVAVEEGIYPALAGYREVLVSKILPAARDDEHAGLAYVPGGPALYPRLIHAATSLAFEQCDPKAIHEYGKSEVARIRAEIALLGGKLFGDSSVATVQTKLREDPALHFQTPAEILGKASEAVGRARGGLRGFFGIVPHTRCEVVPMPGYEEADSTIGFYREPSADGSRPGRYLVNTSAPQTRPRYEAEVLAFHEAIPGHHLQIAIAQERDELPRFRRHFGSTAFAEGWALYTERLCDEMGLYSGDLDRLGMLSFDAWRAARLVVDTGIHAFGWSRAEAIEYLFENTLLARNNVENEIDRYIAWPGQALAYKLGQREILALRDEARATLGASFTYPAFHDRVLENGAVTLGVLRSRIHDWIGHQGEPAIEEPIEASAGR